MSWSNCGSKGQGEVVYETWGKRCRQAGVEMAMCRASVVTRLLEVRGGTGWNWK